MVDLALLKSGYALREPRVARALENDVGELRVASDLKMAEREGCGRTTQKRHVGRSRQVMLIGDPHSIVFVMRAAPFTGLTADAS